MVVERKSSSLSRKRISTCGPPNAKKRTAPSGQPYDHDHDHHMVSAMQLWMSRDHLDEYGYVSSSNMIWCSKPSYYPNGCDPVALETQVATTNQCGKARQQMSAYLKDQYVRASDLPRDLSGRDAQGHSSLHSVGCCHCRKYNHGSIIEMIILIYDTQCGSIAVASTQNTAPCYGRLNVEHSGRMQLSRSNEDCKCG